MAVHRGLVGKGWPCIELSAEKISAEHFSAEKQIERKFLFGAFFQNFTQAWAPILRWEMDLGLSNFSTNYFGCSSKFA